MVDLSLLFYALSWGLGLLFFMTEGEGKFLILLLLLFLLFYFNRTSIHWFSSLLAISIFLLGFGYGSWDGRQTSILSRILPTEGQFSGWAVGQIDSSPVVDGDRLRFILNIHDVKIEDRTYSLHERVWVTIRLNSPEEKRRSEELTRGDKIMTFLTFQRPEPPRNPGAFHFPRYLNQLHIVWTAKEEGLSRFSIQKHGSYLGWKGIETVRSALEERIESLFTPEIAGVIKGMLIGEMEDIPPELTEEYRELGLIHVLAISGFHVMVVIGGIFSLLHLFRFTRERTIDFLFLFIPLYVLITGASPSILRAGMMGFLYLLAKRLHQHYSGVKAISITFLVMTLIDPRQVLGLGFQLSFLVSLFLLLFTQPLSYKLKSFFPKLPDWLSLSIAVLLLAQISSFPFLLQTSYEVSILPLFANFFVVPLFSILIPWGYLTLLLSLFFPTLALYTAIPLEGVFHFLHQIFRLLSGHSSLFFSFPMPPLWGWICYLFFLFLFLSSLTKGKEPMEEKSIIVREWPLFLSFFLLLLFFLLPVIERSLNQEVRITFIDVGQGDAILIQGGGENLLIDGGGAPFEPAEEWRQRVKPFEVGRDLLVPTLRALGVTKLDWVVVTHGDLDHIGGLDEVLSSIPVKRLLGNGLKPTTAMERSLWQKAEEERIPAYRAVSGKQFSLGNKGMITILGPNPKTGLSSGDNNGSVLLLLHAYGKKVLFTGDLEAEGERELISRYSLLKVDLLKVGHHGSKNATSAPFLEVTDPKVAVISVGKKNRYGHPAQEVLDRLKDRGIKVFRTDQSGAVTVTITPEGVMKISSYLDGGSNGPQFTIK